MRSAIVHRGKILVIASLAIAIAFTLYVVILNRKSTNMTIRQKLLKAIYPALVYFNKKAGNHSLSVVNNGIAPVTSLYSLKGVLSNGDLIPLESFRGKKILFVNTASDCGYTNQYAELEQLYQENKDRLVILAFPGNDFKNQERANDEKIAAFCKLNFGITFPLMQKTVVIKGSQQNELFQWLSHASSNGWNNQPPTWNFCKYLVDEKGWLTHFFEPALSPTSKEILQAVNK